MKDTRLTFQRYEKKYLLTEEQLAQLMRELAPHIVHDEYGRSTVCSVYYDTDDYELIRRSLDKPVYKEKLRLRSYGVPEPGGAVFVELKKKYRGVVYKRRLLTDARRAEGWLSGRLPPPEDSQISREIDWFLRFYAPRPRAFIACDREAFVARDDPELRFTFDRDLRWRDTELSLTAGSWGRPLLDEGRVLLEIKMPGAAPLWLAELLGRLRAFPCSFSKYGTCWRTGLLRQYFNGVMEIA